MHRFRMIFIGFLIGVLLLLGCASPRLVPLPDGATINPELRSATNIQEGVTVTVQSSAWRGTPSDLEGFVTAFYVVIRNDTEVSLTFSYDDIALFDEQRIQYNPLSPETVAKMLQAAYYMGYTYAPYFGPVFFGSWFPYFYPFYFNPFFAWWYSPTYYPEPSNDVFTYALFPGVVRSNAQLEGFVYFRKLSPRLERVTLQLSYKLQGEEGYHEMSFPFAFQSGRNKYPGK